MKLDTLKPAAALLAQCRVASPLGPLTLAATAQGLAGVWFDAQQHHPGELELPDRPTNRWLKQATAELRLYFESSLRQFDVALDPQGTAFQRQVWQVLLNIRYGELSTYGQLAQQLGRPSAARAVGAAVGRNPLGIIVPCHRVVGRDGTLTGYAGGLHRKDALLRLEGAQVQHRLELVS